MAKKIGPHFLQLQQIIERIVAKRCAHTTPCNTLKYTRGVDGEENDCSLWLKARQSIYRKILQRHLKKVRNHGGYVCVEESWKHRSNFVIGTCWTNLQSATTVFDLHFGAHDSATAVHCFCGSRYVVEETHVYHTLWTSTYVSQNLHANTIPPRCNDQHLIPKT